MSSNYNTFHQFAIGELFVAFREWTKSKGSGRVILGPVHVRLQEQARLIQPDLFIILSNTWKGDSQVFNGAPDVIVEVLSDDSYRIDKVVKYISYEQVGVKEYWIVNPKMQSVEIYSLAEKEYVLAGEYRGADMVSSPLLPGIKLEAKSIFLADVQCNDEVPAAAIGESMVPA